VLLTAAAPDETTPEARVLSAVERLRRALQSSDRKALDALIAPGFVMVHSTGAVEQRDAYLASLAQRGPATHAAMIVEGTQVRVHDGRTAVVVQTSHRDPATEGTELRLRNTSTWIERGGTWMVVAARSRPGCRCFPAECPSRRGSWSRWWAPTSSRTAAASR